MQKDILEAIKQKGRVEMKARLSQINPNASSPLTQKIAIAAATLATATIVGIGIYTTSINQQIVEQPVTSSETISINTIEKTETDENNVSDVEIVLHTNEEFSSQTVNTIETKESITIPTATSSTNDEVVVEKPTNTLSKNDFDPTSFDLNDNGDDNKLGTNSDVEMDPSKSQSDVTGIPTNYEITNSKVNGYSYDGTSIGISGVYESTYIVTKKLGKLVFEYDNKYYEIVVSDKLEKWEDHQITDLNILEKLK